jgi:hypothetical protein
MTRKELQTELNKIEIFIEVLRDLVEKPICGCISHMDGFNKQFQTDNTKLLNDLMELKYYLTPFKKHSDTVLEEIVYQPVDVYR